MLRDRPAQRADVVRKIGIRGLQFVVEFHQRTTAFTGQLAFRFGHDVARQRVHACEPLAGGLLLEALTGR